MRKTFLLLLITLLTFACLKFKPYVRSFDYKENQKARLLFDDGLAFKKNGQYEEAIIHFARFLDYYHDLHGADEALLHLSESYQALGEWNEAVRASEKLIKKYPSSRHRPKIMFDKGECCEKLSNWKCVGLSYEEVIKEYFGTDWSKRAEDKLIQLFSRFPQEKWTKKVIKRINKKFPHKEYPSFDFTPRALFIQAEGLEKQMLNKEAVDQYINIVKDYYITKWKDKSIERINNILDKFKETKWAEKKRKELNKIIKKQEKKLKKG